jgi:hypothetical protein
MIVTKSFAIVSYFSAGRSKAYYEVPLSPYRPRQTYAMYHMCLEITVIRGIRKNVIPSDKVIEGIWSLKVGKVWNCRHLSMLVLPFYANFILIDKSSRLYWYRGVTVLLPGWVIWKYMWFVHANLSIGRLTSARTVDLHWGEWGSIPLLTLTL